MAFPEDALKYRVRIDPAADLTALPSTYTWPYDITSDVSFSRSRPITIKAGAADEQQESDAEVSLVLRNFADRSSITQIEGRYTVDNPQSDLYDAGFDIGCPVEISIDPGVDVSPTWYPQAVQYLAEEKGTWPGRAPTDNMALSGWVLAGLLRRLQSGKAVRSPLNRTLRPADSAGSPIDYWPLESVGAATETAVTWPSTTFETPAAQSTPAYAGTSPSVFGSYAGPTWGGKNDRLKARFHGGGSMGSTDAYELGFGLYLLPGQESGAVTHDFRIRIPSAPSVTVGYFELSCQYDRDAAGNVDLDACRIVLGVYDLEGVLLDDNPTTGINPFDGIPRYIEIETVRTGFATFDVQLRIDGTEQFTLSLAGAPQYAQEITFGEQGDGANNAGITWSVTHLYFAYSDGNAYPVGVGWASRGYPGEYAHVRVSRLCNEDSVPVRVYDEDNISVEMGPQSPAALVPLLRECEKAEYGILDDRLGYVNLITAREMTAIEPWLTVDGRDRELFTPYDPVTDDLRALNDVTATPPAGGEGIRYTDEDDIERRGRRDATIQPNLEGLKQLASSASMAVAQGTVPGKRYPSITLDFLRWPSATRAATIEAWLDLGANGPLGKRIDVLGQPLAAGPQERDVRTQTRGFVLTLIGRRGGLRLELNTVPYEPWDAGTWAETGDGGTHEASGVNPARFDHKRSVIDDDLTSSTTTFDVVSEIVRWIDGEAPKVDDPFIIDSASDWPTPAGAVGPWVKFDGSTAADYIVNGGAGKHIVTNTGNRRISAVDIGGSGDGWVYSESSWPVNSANTTSLVTRHYMRMTNTSNYVQVSLSLTTSGTRNLSASSVLAGASTTLLASHEVGSGYVANQVWCMLTGIVGTDVYAVAWLKGSLPGSWPMETWTESVGVPTTGHFFGVASNREASNGNANATQSFGEVALMTTRFGRAFPFDIEVGGERMRVSSISGTGLTQAFTVTRSINGVSKAHDKDNAVTRLRHVRLFRPARVSLT